MKRKKQHRVTARVVERPRIAFSDRAGVVAVRCDRNKLAEIFAQRFDACLTTAAPSLDRGAIVDRLIADGMTQGDAAQFVAKVHGEAVLAHTCAALGDFEARLPVVLSVFMEFAVSLAELAGAERVSGWEYTDEATGRPASISRVEKRADWRKDLVSETESSLRKITIDLVGTSGAPSKDQRNAEIVEFCETRFAKLMKGKPKTFENEARSRVNEAAMKKYDLSLKTLRDIRRVTPARKPVGVIVGHPNNPG